MERSALPSPAERPVSVRELAVALVPGLLLALVVAREAPAQQNVCRGGPHIEWIIECNEPGADSANDILVAPGRINIETRGDNAAVSALHRGAGGIEFRMTDGAIMTLEYGRRGGLDARHEGSGNTVIRMTGGSVATEGQDAIAVQGVSSGTGNVTILLEGGSVATSGHGATAVRGAHSGTDVLVERRVGGNTTTGRVHIRMTDGSVATTGTGAAALSAVRSGRGAASIYMSGGSVATTGAGAAALNAVYSGTTDPDIAVETGASISVHGGSISTKGRNAPGVSAAVTGGAGLFRLEFREFDAYDKVRVRTEGANATGIDATGNTPDFWLNMEAGLVETAGAGAVGLRARSVYARPDFARTSVIIGAATIRTRGGVYTDPETSVSSIPHGAYIERSGGQGDFMVYLQPGGVIETAAAGAHGLYVVRNGGQGGSRQAHRSDAEVEFNGGAIAVTGSNARGVLITHTGLGDIATRLRGGDSTHGWTAISAPFGVGFEARATNDANAAGRLDVTYGGKVEAREVGVLAWAARSSGHTMGAGAQTADGAARTDPTIHVRSSGDIAVGAPATDAFIRSRIAGADETLSDLEQIVLDAVAAEDSGALDEALAELPAAYGDDWKAEARALLAKRAAAPTGDAAQAHRAAEEILGLSRAGVRAVALSHTGIADYVRGDDALSDAERTVLQAVLTGSGLEAALAALPAAYTTEWKDGVRQRALTYNAGGIRVNITGGSIAAEGNGVEALYAVPHDRNGAVSVGVAGGARVAGGANGIYVANAGGGAEGRRAQSVTVNGAATGGTGAGVRMDGGGLLTVGGIGVVGAASGVGVLSDGGDLHATVEGTVHGDIRVRGGALRLDVRAGGAVTGTVRDPIGPLTVAGGIGRILYSNGGTVTVTRTGRLTGVDGVAIRSDAGDLEVTVDGMAMGDILGLGDGDHTVTVTESGTVTGTIRLAASTVRVDGAAGCVRLDSGGMVAVGATGRVACADGAGVRSDSGDFAAMVAGAVTGDVVALGSGEHRIAVAAGAQVTGAVRAAATGSAVAVAGTVGKVSLDNGGAVTVEATGRIPGIDGVSVESRAGVATVTIAVAADESERDAAARVGGAIVAPGGMPSVTFRREGGARSRPLGEIGTPHALADGAHDVGVERTATGATRVVGRLAARTRVYEALPSLLLGMERPASHAERMAAPRASNGAWARVDASRGSWEAARSANVEVDYDHRGFSLQAGVDAALGEETQAGASVHWRRATAEVSQGGEIDARGVGVGLSATWASGPFYVDGQAAATLYDADLTSMLRGTLKDDARARGLSAALEAGRTVPVADGVAVTPRARVAYSSLSFSGFDDSAGARVSLDRGRSLTARAGALAERVFGESRLFGSFDIEREFEAEAQLSVARTSLAAAGDETRWLAGVGAEHGWEDGRFTLRGALGYTGSGGAHDYGGRAGLSMRF